MTARPRNPLLISRIFASAITLEATSLWTEPDGTPCLEAIAA